MVETYKQLAKFKFECGDYQASREMLANYISLYAKPPASQAANAEEEELLAYSGSNKKDDKKEDVGNPAIYYLKYVNHGLLQVLWGKLACDILVEDWVSQ